VSDDRPDDSIREAYDRKYGDRIYNPAAKGARREERRSGPARQDGRALRDTEESAAAIA
jgi:hypothetical protein